MKTLLPLVMPPWAADVVLPCPLVARPWAAAVDPEAEGEWGALEEVGEEAVVVDQEVVAAEDHHKDGGNLMLCMITYFVCVTCMCVSKG